MTARRRWRTRATAAALVLAVITTLGGSAHPFDSGSPFALMGSAAALHDRWVQMIVDGVPASDLAQLESEWSRAQSTPLLGVGVVFWWPDTRAVVERWRAESDAIWARNVRFALGAAMMANLKLERALGSEPSAQLGERALLLSAASTPAQLLALRADWDLEARLVSIDKTIAADVASLSALAAKARAIGIVADPAAAMLARARDYAASSNSARFALAGRLSRDSLRAERDLGARIAAARLAVEAFGRAAGEVNLAALYGVSVSGYQGRIASQSKSFAVATSASQFGAITKVLDGIVTELKHLVAVVQSQTHLISGVSFYSQSHSLSCEEAAVSMALTHQGIHLSQDQILAEMGADRRPMYRDANGIVRWGNPYLSFVGSVDGSESNYTGSQANYPPLVRVATAHGARILAYGYLSAATVYARVSAGHPVVVWATWDWAWHPRHDYLSFDGRWIPWIGPVYASHVYTVVGVRPDAVLVNDPMRGQYWVGKAAFQAAYSDFSEAIVFA
jgi:uncharacterized protein YvpB